MRLHDLKDDMATTLEDPPMIYIMAGVPQYQDPYIEIDKKGNYILPYIYKIEKLKE